MKNIVALIPARGGSKEIKNKNLLPLKSKPLIYWSIKLAKKIKFFDRVVVSTDSLKIKSVAEKFGAEVPFIRNKKLSNDYTASIEVLLDCIRKINSKNVKYHFFIYPGAPLINSKDLIKAFKIIKEKKFDHLVAMSNYSVTPLAACKIQKNNIIKFRWPKYALKKSRKLSKLIHDTGTFYIYKTKALLVAQKRGLARSLHFINRKKTTHYLLHKLKSVDINTIEDFRFAEFLYKFKI